MRAATVVGALLVLVAAVGAGVAPAAGAGAGVGSADQADCSFPVTETDKTGTEVTLEEPAERIVTLNPSAAQTLWELDAREAVVGVSSNAQYLEGAEEKEVISEGFEYDTETIISLEPDVVLAPNATPEEVVESLRNNGVTVFYFPEAESFEDVYEKTETIGHFAGECEAADAVVTDMRQRIEAVEAAVADEDRPGVLYSFFGFTAGNGTFIHGIFEAAGTTNVAAEVGITDYAELNDEVIVDRADDIEYLILNSDPASHPSSDAYNETAAVREDRTVVVNENYLNQPAPRTVLAVETVVEAVHPEAYEEAQASLQETATPTVTADTDATTATATATPTEASDDGPGFTAGAAVAAVLAAALLFRRR
jgi:iron complex transport system substrate-binding protein